MAESHGPATERVVIIGAGFAGIEVARSLGKARIPATLIDRRNYHLFQPLLYQVATAALSPADIAEPIRKMLRRYPSVEVVLGEVTAIDSNARHVVLSSGNNFNDPIIDPLRNAVSNSILDQWLKDKRRY